MRKGYTVKTPTITIGNELVTSGTILRVNPRTYTIQATGYTWSFRCNRDLIDDMNKRQSEVA